MSESIPADPDDESPPKDSGDRFRRLTDPAESSEKPPTPHPTGDPHKTGGWFGELENEEKPKGSSSPENEDPDATQPWSPEEEPDPLVDTPQRPQVRLDSEGMPLPKKVPETDPARTRVQPRVAYRDQASRTSTPRKRQPSGKQGWRYALRRIGRIALTLTAIVAVLGIVIVVGTVTFGILQYYRISATLPDVGELRARAADFESTFIYDRVGNQLYEINDPQAGRRTFVPLDQISPYAVAATIATEDREYWNNPGFDPAAIARALWQNYREGEIVSGASTITQQLARALLLEPEERAQQTNERKLREIILAAQMRAAYGSDEILELYLNEIYYGNLAYGIEAAAQTYFGKRASELNFAEGAFLAGLPQSPANYDIYQNPELTFGRQEVVVTLIVRAGTDCIQFSGGIQINSAGQRLCVTAAEGVTAILGIKDPAQYPFVPPRIEAVFPHWVNYVRLLLEEEYGAQEIYRSGFRVFTTLNPELQSYAQEQVSQQVNAVAAANVTNGALVAILPQSGEIVALVGSDNYDDLPDGQINMAIRPRQPGSSIKPFTYLRAFELGWTPATVIWDVPSKFDDGVNPAYEPRNYDGRFHGPLRVRDALANSFNVPAVKALEYVGIYDDPDTDETEGLLPFLETFGVSTLSSDQYGSALTLGGGEITLLEWTGAYATLANEGRRVFPVAITHITDANGEEICRQPTAAVDLSAEGTAALPACLSLPDNWGQPVVSPEHAFLITNIISDDSARLLAFGPGNALENDVGAAVKTGTTNDIRDVWSMGFTPNLAVGVWFGNADFTPMAEGVTSSGTATPVWKRVLTNAFEILGIEPGSFRPPERVVLHEICEVTGAAANEYCFSMTNPRYPGRGGVRQEYFVADEPPLPREEDFVATIEVDAFSGKLASELCNSTTLDERRVVNIRDPFALEWLQGNPLGQQFAQVLGVEFPVELAPTEECGPDDPRAVVRIIFPPEDTPPVFEVVQIWGYVDVLNGEFDSYRVDWGLGDDPQGWGSLSDAIPERHPDDGSPALLAEFDTRDQPNEIVTIRVIVRDNAGHEAETRRVLAIDNPTPTATAANTPTALPTFTHTATITLTPTPTITPSNTPTFTATIPSATPVPSDTATTEPSATPSETAPAASATPESPTPTETVSPSPEPSETA